MYIMMDTQKVLTQIDKKHYGGGKVKQLLKIDGGNGISSLEPKMDGGKGHSFDNRVKDQTTFLR